MIPYAQDIQFIMHTDETIEQYKKRIQMQILTNDYEYAKKHNDIELMNEVMATLLSGKG